MPWATITATKGSVKQTTGCRRSSCCQTYRLSIMTQVFIYAVFWNSVQIKMPLQSQNTLAFYFRKRNVVMSRTEWHKLGCNPKVILVKSRYGKDNNLSVWTWRRRVATRDVKCKKLLFRKSCWNRFCSVLPPSVCPPVNHVALSSRK